MQKETILTSIAFLSLVSVYSHLPSQANPTHRAASVQKKRIYLPVKTSSDNYVADMEFAEYWQPRRMPLKVFIHDCSSVPNFDPSYIQSFKDSCEKWSNASGSKIQFVFVDSEKDADLEVLWTESRKTWPSDDTNELGVTSISSFKGEKGIDHAKVFLLTTHYQNHAQISVAAMEKIALHELGHAFGLGHSSLETDIMYKSLSLYACAKNGKQTMEPTRQNGLSQRDGTTMSLVYVTKPTLDSVREKHLDPTNACAELINESIKQNDRGDYAQAIICLNEALRIDENNSIAMNNLIAIYYNCGVSKYNSKEYKQAMIPISKAIALSQRQGKIAQAQQFMTLRSSCMQAGGIP